ncbi:MAG TPA: preprotein translocase subunit YajC [Stenotrophobium sp.]|nr:preprotein translocase subunit YajC [Stenotrophobium sp.]
MLDFILSPAYAQSGAPSANPLLQFLPLVFLIVLFYFMLIRPQQKRNKETKQMLASLAKGDEVTTSGGLAGRLVNLGETYVSLEIADNVVVKVTKSSIIGALPKGTLKSV